MPKTRRHAQKGFTLVELLVVIAILGTLSIIVAVNVLPAGDRANAQAAKTQVDTLAQALTLYKLNHQSFPTEQQGLQVLVEAPQRVRFPERYPASGYLNRPTLPMDPWGNEYQYVYPGQFGEFDVVSLGPDGRPSTDDIGSWQ